MTSTVRAIVAVGLVAAVLVCLAGAIVLSFTGHPIPTVLEVTAGVAAGALVRVMPSDRAEPPPPPSPPAAP